MTRPFWAPDRHADRRPFLLARNRIKSSIRAWLEREDFVEVDPGCLQVSPGNEAHLHAFATQRWVEGGGRQQLYLHTSPEFAMKKLLAAGEQRIFALAPVFRNGEAGRLHSPEFTMLEWYRAGEPYARLLDDAKRLLELAAGATQRTLWSWRDSSCDVSRIYVATTVHEAFERHAQIDLNACFDGVTPSLPRMQERVRRIGVRVADDDTWSDLFSRVLAERIEPKLGAGSPEMLTEYPTHEAALARPCAHDPRVAERFELYVCGVELANGFGELTDPAEQRRRFEQEMAEKERVYGHRYPIDEDFLTALGGMPPASGCALGLDRLVMLATGATDIAQVLWTPAPDMV